MTGPWHIVTGEYPPQPGGVSDYSRTVAEGLAAAGASVHVWAPPAAGPSAPETGSAVRVHRLPDLFGEASLAAMNRELDEGPRPHTLLVQYVPQAFGKRGMNLRFCRWVQHRARTPDADVRVMFHEPFFPFVAWPPHRNLLALANRIMAVLLLSDIRVAYVSTRAWERRLSRYAPRSRFFEWLPVPAAVPAEADPASVARWRALVAPAADCRVVGHFGTYGILVTRLLEPALESLLTAKPEVQICLVGPGSEMLAARFVGAHPECTAQVHAVGTLPAAEVSACIRACDVMLQPYADGVSGRRTTLMAALANGVATVTTRGPATEPEWAQDRAVVLENPRPRALGLAVVRLLDDDSERARAAGAALAVYERRFTARNTVDRLLTGPARRKG